MYRRDPWDWASSILCSIGAINWGLVSFGNFNLVEAIFGEDSMMTNLVYGMVGLAGLWNGYRLFQDLRTRREMMAPPRQNIFSIFGGR